MKTLIVCSACGSTSIGQFYVINPNETDESTLYIEEIWEYYICFDCEDDCETEVVSVQ